MNGIKLTAAAAVLAAIPAVVLADQANDNFITNAENCAVQAMTAIDLSEVETLFSTSANTTYQTRTFGDAGLTESTTHRRAFDIFGDNRDEVAIEADIRIVNDPSATLVEFEVLHDGTKGHYTDASRAGLTLQFINDSLGTRSGFAITSEFGVNITDQVHGQWTIDAAQTLEANFMSCMNQEEHPNRPATAAVSVGPAPDFLQQTP